MEQTKTSTESSLDKQMLHRKFYVPAETWWSNIQEEGKPIEDSTKTNRTFVNKGLYFPNLYDLTRKMHALFLRDRQVFEQLPTNKSDICRRMAQEILKLRFQVDRADMNRIVDDTMLPFMQKAPREQAKFYVLSQKDMIKWAMSKWSSLSIEKLRKTTENDRLRVFGIMFSDDLREHVPLVTGTCNHTKNRGQLDEKNGLLRAVLQKVHDRFHDKEIVVVHPILWMRQDTIDKVGSTIHANLNPNDKQRIEVARTIDGIKTIIKTTTRQYNTIMNNYTKGTGGGSGHPANFANWQERDPLFFEDYDSHSKSSYLTYIHMFNQQYDHPMVKIHDQLPNEARIEDMPGPRSTQKVTPSQLLDKLEEAGAQMEVRSKERLDSMKNLFAELKNEGKSDGNTDSTNVSKVLRDLKESTDSELDHARSYLVKEVGDLVPKINAMTEMIVQCQEQMKNCKDERNRDGFMKGKKRKRNYEKNRDVLEHSQVEVGKRLKQVNKELGRRNGNDLLESDDSDSDDFVSDTGY